MGIRWAALSALVLLLAWADPARAVTAVLTWNPNPELTVVSYRVYRTAASPCSAITGNLLATVQAPNTQYVDVGITQTQYYCITAVDDGLRESTPSATVTAAFPTVTPGGTCE